MSHIEWQKRRGLHITDWAEKKKFKDQIKTLEETIKWFEGQIEPHDCGWMYTTIDGIKHRIKFLKKEAQKSRSKAVW